jgi:hypothetical protein
MSMVVRVPDSDSQTHPGARMLWIIIINSRIRRTNVFSLEASSAFGLPWTWNLPTAVSAGVAPSEPMACNPDVFRP